MKVAIIETEHFQYALTQSEIFHDCEKIFFVLPLIKKQMQEYNSALCNGKFYIVESINKNEVEIINICKEEKIDLLLISPVFGWYKSVLNIVRSLDCKKVITTHNLNTWFNPFFWSPNSFKDRIYKKSILKSCDYIAVEDFIYNYLATSRKELNKKYNFIYIPFTIFHPQQTKKYFKEHDKLKIVLTGSIDKERRRYEDVISAIHYFACKKTEITFSFAGKAIGEYGRWVISELDKANSVSPGIATYFGTNETFSISNANPEKFLREMETSDLVLSTSTEKFKSSGTTEYIGKTKPTAAIHDMISYRLPGLLPAHLKIPENLKGSVFNYHGLDGLLEKLNLLLDKNVLSVWKNKAMENSLLFTSAEIRKQLPFHKKDE